MRGRDGGNGVELGLGFESCVEMDEPEFEEGEACSYQDFDDDDNDYDPNVDPDVSLSYIGEKLQHVLGHFQKDFEGVFTAENLGAKFGDYGSFLPSYQRAPAWSQFKSPAKVDNHTVTTSLSKSHPEGGVHGSRRNKEASVSNGAKRTEAILSTHCKDVSSSRFELEENYGPSSDQNIVNACIVVGSDNLSNKKLAEVYDRVGLDLSSSSSLGESPNDIEGDAPKESPSRILQIMTSLPVHENSLLSPLTEYLINFTVKQKKLCKEGKSRVSLNVGKASMTGPDPFKSDERSFRDKKPKSFRKGISSLELKNLNGDNTRKDHGVLLLKENDIDNLACEKLALAASKDTVNGENFEMNVLSKESSIIREVKAPFLSKTESNVSKRRKAENAEFIDDSTLQEENVQLPLRKEHSSSGRQKKLKETQVRNESDNSVLKREMENPKTDENNAKAVNIYKDLFGEMELDKELDMDENCSIDMEEDDMLADRSKLAPNSAMEDRRKETNVHVSQDDQAPFDKSSKTKIQAAMDNRSLNGISSPLGKEVEPLLLPQSNAVEKHVCTEAVSDRLFEQRPNGGEYLSFENNSKRSHDQNGSRVSKKIRMDVLHCREENEERETEKLCQVNGSHLLKSRKKSLLRAKEVNGNCKSEIDKGKAKIYDSGDESMDCTGSYKQLSNVNSGKLETKLVAKKGSIDEGAKESVRSESLTKSGENNGSAVKFDTSSSHDQKQNLRLNVGERSLEKQPDKVDQGEVSEKRKSHSLPPSGRDQNETRNHSRHLNCGEHKENRVNIGSMNASEGGNESEALKQKNSLDTNGITLRQSTPNGHRVGDKDVPTSGKRDSYSPAVSNALKEATDLKHLADRLKNTGSSVESTGLYFRAALKFLHAASLLESGSGESTKQSEAIKSMPIYSSTGQLCGFCAHEYEKSKDMATAALAYKCMEVAYMRVIYSLRGRASRDRLELEAASQIGLPGESPLSSASDVDNLNNLKSDKSKTIVSPPQVAALSNHVISAGNRPIFVSLLNYAQDVNSAMEASRKCKIAFAAANQRMEETKCREDGIASVKRALDFNFQDVEGLLRLVRLAMEAISH